VLDEAYLFESLGDVRRITSRWLRDYDDWRPHEALGGIPPRLYRERVTFLGRSTPL